MDNESTVNNLPTQLQAQLQLAAQQVKNPMRTDDIRTSDAQPGPNKKHRHPTAPSSNTATATSLGQSSFPLHPPDTQRTTSNTTQSRGYLANTSSHNRANQQAKQSGPYSLSVNSPYTSSNPYSQDKHSKSPPRSRTFSSYKSSPHHPGFPPPGKSASSAGQASVSYAEQASLLTSPVPSGTSQIQNPPDTNLNALPTDYGMSSESSRAFFQSAADGAYRHGDQSSRGLHGGYHPSHSVKPWSPTIAMDAPDGSFQRPTPQNARLFNPQEVSQARFGDQQASAEGKAVVQSEYLESIAHRELQKEASAEEMQAKENFRKKLERIVHSTLGEYAKENVLPFDPKQVRLKCYGSLANGFAVAGSDMDLLLMFPKEHGPPGPIESKSGRMLEKVFLDAELGARLLTQTRVPIMRICERPGKELLDALRQTRLEWDDEMQEVSKKGDGGKDTSWAGRENDLPSEPSSQTSNGAIVTSFAELDINPAEIPLPDSPVHGHTHLEFRGDVGIQCDINFSNYVAVYNTALLRCYCKCDPRVRQMGLLIKSWAKARKINSPYHGTLSSYGYIIMVLYYLIHVAKPPVVPNLQQIEKHNRSKQRPPPPPKMCEGFDVTFFDNEREITRLAVAGRITKNRETLGSLLRGFFRYYSDFRGFHWTKNVISIRNPGSLLTKYQKGWTGAKWEGDEKNVRQRYLLAIEDPFEVHHNIARTVGHSGIVAIRDEFRRASDILNNVQSIPGVGWQWRKPDGMVGEDLLEVAEERGDLHKKDQEGRAERLKAARAKARQAKLEGKEEGIISQASEKSLAPNAAGAEAKVNGKAMETAEPIELTKPKNRQAGRKSHKNGKKKHVKASNKHVNKSKGAAVSQQRTAKKQVEANTSSSYQSSDASNCANMLPLPDWRNSTFDPTRYRQNTAVHTPPKTPKTSRSAVFGAQLSTNEPTPPQTPSLSTSRNDKSKKGDPIDATSMFIRNTTLLDPRQLLDIQTIQRGGNGCVRNEEDFESSWGGGGRMGSDRDTLSRVGSRRKGDKFAKKEDAGSSEDIGSQWNQVVEDMLRDARQGYKVERTKVTGREVDARDLTGELPFHSDSDI